MYAVEFMALLYYNALEMYWWYLEENLSKETRKQPWKLCVSSRFSSLSEA